MDVKTHRCWKSIRVSVNNMFFHVFFPNSNSFGVFSHSKGFGAELLSDSQCFSGADPSWAAKRFRLERFCGRFAHHFFTLVSQFLHSFSPTALAFSCIHAPSRVEFCNALDLEHALLCFCSSPVSWLQLTSSIRNAWNCHHGRDWRGVYFLCILLSDRRWKGWTCVRTFSEW